MSNQPTIEPSTLAKQSSSKPITYGEQVKLSKKGSKQVSKLSKVFQLVPKLTKELIVEDEDKDEDDDEDEDEGTKSFLKFAQILICII